MRMRIGILMILMILYCIKEFCVTCITGPKKLTSSSQGNYSQGLLLSIIVVTILLPSCVPRHVWSPAVKFIEMH